MRNEKLNKSKVVPQKVRSSQRAKVKRDDKVDINSLSTLPKDRSPTLSVVIIAKDEEEKIKDCLESVKWMDEIVLIDSGSTDNTKDIAKKYGVKTFQVKGGSYDKWRNEGLKIAKGRWLLYVDADERVTPGLKQEITRLIDGSIVEFNAYAIPRKNIILGKELKHGGFGEYDYVKRLFRKDKLKKWIGILHEEPNYYHEGKLTIGKKGDIGHLKNKLIHIKATSLTEMVDKTNKWSEIEAKLMYDTNHPKMNIPRFITAMTREFWFRFVKKKAFLDGTIGIIHGIYQVYSRFISYAKLWELQLNSNLKNEKAK
jgi:glycosyltransferase involved in cell wall biosynthesis